MRWRIDIPLRQYGLGLTDIQEYHPLAFDPAAGSSESFWTGCGLRRRW